MRYYPEILKRAQQKLRDDPSGIGCINYLISKGMKDKEVDRYFKLAEYKEFIKPYVYSGN